MKGKNRQIIVSNFSVLMEDMGYSNFHKRRLQNEEAVFRNITAGVDVFISPANDGRGKCKLWFFAAATATHPFSCTTEDGGAA
jgi:hypothetical protein